MERGVGDALADLGRQLVDMAFALSEHVDQLGAAAVAERLGDLPERIEQPVFRLSITHAQLLKELLDNLHSCPAMFKTLLEEWVTDGIRMFVDEGLGPSSYLVDLGVGTAAIVDPPRFPTEHLATARTSGLAPRWTIDTHSHAGYVTGSPSLATDNGVTFIAPATSKLETPTERCTTRT